VLANSYLHKVFNAAVVFLALCFAAPAWSVTITAFGEEFPPYSFAVDGQASGIASDLLRAVCLDAGVDCRIQILPWSRAYRDALNIPNTMVFLTVRSPDRESQFDWIGPVLPREIWLYGLADFSAPIRSFDELAGYRIAVVYNDVSVVQLKEAGAPETTFNFVTSHDSTLRMLFGHRVDLAADTEIAMRWYLRHNGHESDEVRKVLLLPMREELYFAINKDSDAATVERLKQSWAKIAASPLRDEVVQRYIGR